ncbi:MAG: hypothetical protein HC882_03455 [Acidobacteria bacterium]|nr:hypothetical protein [Acidobacteriota bacterium]
MLPLDQDGGPTRVDVERETATRWRVRSHWQDGSFDLKRGTGEVILTERTWDKFAMSVENFLRVMLQAAAFARESFLLHAAPIIDGDRAVLLAGPSGAGKSTAAAYALPRPALSDDLALIDLSREEPRVITVPLYQADPPGQRLRGSFPIAALVRLRQAPEDEVVPMSAAARSPPRARSSLARDLGYDAERLVTLTAGLAAHVPAFEARVTKSARLWELLPPLLAAKR